MKKILLTLAILSASAFLVSCGGPSSEVVNSSWEKIGVETSNENEIGVLIITDKRCSDCNVSGIQSTLDKLEIAKTLKYSIKDFSDEGVEEFLKENNLSSLPAVIFETKSLGNPDLERSLITLKNGGFRVNNGAAFNPFVEMSERGYQVLSQDQIASLTNGFTTGDENAEISVLEYVDLDCPYCANLHNGGLLESLEKEFGTNTVFKNFALSEIHPTAKTAAMIVECVGRVGGNEKFAEMVSNAFSGGNRNKSYLLANLPEGVTKAEVEECLKDKTVEEKILNDRAEGTLIFSISGTPRVIAINNNSGEFVELPWTDTESTKFAIERLSTSGNNSN